MSRQGAASVAAPGPSLVASRRAARLPLVALFTGTLVVAVFLLFTVQPMFAKWVLPVLGGTPAIWSVATLVFPMLLLAG